VVVEGGVQVAVADQRLVVDAAAGGAVLAVATGGDAAAVGAPAAAVGDSAELFDVYVHQIAGVLAFVAAHRFTGGPVQVRQPRHAFADQHPVHGRGVHPEPAGDHRRAELSLRAQVLDPSHQRPPCCSGLAVWSAGSVDHPGWPVTPVPVGPPLRGGHRDLEPFRGAAQRPAVVDDTAGQA
jgi:hypothetical protein